MFAWTRILFILSYSLWVFWTFVVFVLEFEMLCQNWICGFVYCVLSMWLQVHLHWYFSSMNGQGEFKFHYLWDWKQERQLVSKWVSCRLLINFIAIVYICSCSARRVSKNYVIMCSCNWLDVLNCRCAYQNGCAQL